MGELLRRIREAQGISVLAPDATPAHTSVSPTPLHESIARRLKELQEQTAAFGGATLKDRRLIASLEAQLSGSHVQPGALPVEPGAVPEY